MNYQARPARRSLKLIGLYLKGVACAVALCLVMWALARFGVLPGWLCTLGGLVAIFGCLGAPEAVRATTLYEIREGEVRSSYGIINRREENIRAQGVLSCEVQQSLLERLVLRTGTVVFASGATNSGSDDISFFGVSSPQAAVRALRDSQSGISAAPAADPSHLPGPAASEVMASPQRSTTGPAQMPPMDGGLPPR